MRCLVALDDTDSSQGFCTTYLAFRLAAELAGEAEVLPYPRLVRLNPNVPFKTRGNAAVCIPIDTPDPGSAFDIACAVTSRLADVAHGANPGLVLLEGEGSGTAFRELYLDAVSGMVNRARARNLLAAHGARVFTMGNGMGIVGAAAALAFDESYDHTYELISYRSPLDRCAERPVDPRSVIEMDLATFPHTFNNFDYQKGKVLVTPHGPDPVLMGVRGDSPGAVVAAYHSIRLASRPEGHLVYLSNQYTDAHLWRGAGGVYSSGWATGEVAGLSVSAGGHVSLDLITGSGTVSCMVYEPTGDLNRAARLLRRGDALRVYGGVRRGTAAHRVAINVEKFDLLSLSRRGVRSNPPCPRCGNRTKSEGRGKGFQCRKCGRRLRERDSRLVHERRAVVEGTYAPSPRANRHLTKPLIRYGRENPGAVSARVAGWFSPAAISVETPKSATMVPVATGPD